jgi:predicted nucleic acid-binding protein
VVAIIVYLDTDLVGALLITEPLSDRAELYLDTCRDVLLISDLTGAEFASLVARRVRTGEFTIDQARAALSHFEAWTEVATQRIEIGTADLSAARSFLRRLDLPLRTLDAIHVAIARRLEATLATFDRQMAASARTLGIPVVTP